MTRIIELFKEQIRILLETEQSPSEVNDMTAQVVKQAALTLKPHKMDISQGFASDALLHARMFSSASLPWFSGAVFFTTLLPSPC